MPQQGRSTQHRQAAVNHIGWNVAAEAGGEKGARKGQEGRHAQSGQDAVRCRPLGITQGREGAAGEGGRARTVRPRRQHHPQAARAPS
eukprot:4734014-Heterocapsa_arctica.AAC.1